MDVGQTPQPARGVGFTPHQRNVVRAVEEESMLDQVSDFVTRMNRMATRLEAYVEEEPRTSGEPK